MIHRKNGLHFSKKLGLGGVAFLGLGLGAQALAAPHHIAVATDTLASSSANCVFPDGTSPDEDALHCYNPTQFLQAYGIDKVHAMGLTGKGQTIILVDSYGSPTLQKDLDHFSDTFGLPHTTIEFIYPDGTYVNPLTTDDEVGWAGETTLDLEWAHAIAPDATLVNIVSNSDEVTGMSGMQDLFNGIQTAIQKYPGAIVSMSFGTGEGTFTSDEAKTYLQGSLHQILQQATTAGMTLLASSGDQGSANANTADTSLESFADASYPATDPLITAVGGSAIEAGWTWTPQGTADDIWNCRLDNAILQSNHQSPKKCPMDFLLSASTPGSLLETVWKEDWAPAAGGGGVSTVFAAPDYQSGLNANVQKIANGHRAIPDLAMNAAINGGVETYQSYVVPGQKTQAPSWQVVGGTSCASPETAGLIALAGQEVSQELGKPAGVGALNPILYSLGARDFNDIVPQTFGVNQQVTIDNNAYYFGAAALQLLPPKDATPVQVPGYFTLPGYDLATGLGSPHAADFVMDVAHARVAIEGTGLINQTRLSER